MSENRRRVLGMLAEGKITADEAERLLTTVDQPETGGSGFSASGMTPNDERKFLRVVVEPIPGAGGEQTHVNVRVPMALIRAGVKLTSLIPSNATTKINEELQKSGVEFDVSNIKPENLNELVDAMKDLQVDLDSEKEKVRVYLE